MNFFSRKKRSSDTCGTRVLWAEANEGIRYEKKIGLLRPVREKWYLLRNGSGGIIFLDFEYLVRTQYGRIGKTQGCSYRILDAKCESIARLHGKSSQRRENTVYAVFFRSAILLDKPCIQR